MFRIFALLGVFAPSPYTVWLPVTVAVMLSPSARAVFVKLFFVRAVPSYSFESLSAVIVTVFLVSLSRPFT